MDGSSKVWTAKRREFLTAIFLTTLLCFRILCIYVIQNACYVCMMWCVCVHNVVYVYTMWHVCVTRWCFACHNLYTFGMLLLTILYLLTLVIVKKKFNKLLKYVNYI